MRDEPGPYIVDFAYDFAKQVIHNARFNATAIIRRTSLTQAAQGLSEMVVMALRVMRIRFNLQHVW
jgi:hypothetical protein